MGKFIVDLKGLLVPEVTVVQGTIMSVAVDTVYVSSPNGPKQFKVANPGTYKAGDKVRFQGDVFIGTVPDETNVPHYSV